MSDYATDYSSDRLVVEKSGVGYLIGNGIIGS